MSDKWKKKLINLLREDRDLRVFSPAILYQKTQENDIEVSRRHLTTIIGDWSDLGILKRLTHGVFINNQAKPAVNIEESVPFIRKNAVVSLQRVLTNNGVINNPSAWITSVIPNAAGVTGGLVEADFATFQFSSMSSNFFPEKSSPIYNDAYDRQSLFPSFTPEKALVDWLYLSSVSNGHARSLPPRWDIDMDMLDTQKLSRLTNHFGLEFEFDLWLNNNPIKKNKPSLRCN